MGKQIFVVMNRGGVISDVYVSPEFKDAEVSIIDFCTDDPEEQTRADEELKKVSHLVAADALQRIF